MNEYTKEPWEYQKECVGNYQIAHDHSGAGTLEVTAKAITEANARRIVACVNACVGVDAENITNFRLAAALSYWKNVESQRDELLAALHAVSSWIRNIPHGENCFVSSHYDGDPGNQCNCGKESILDFVELTTEKAEDTK